MPKVRDENVSENMGINDNLISTEVNSKDLYHQILGSKIKRTRNHRCFICLKYFASNYSKNRHIKRIHKSLEKGKLSAPSDESNSESTKQKTKTVKRKNFDDVIRGPPVPRKRNRLSQGIKRKKEENDKIMKKTRFQDWN